jgi:hypothetical protein
MRRDEADACRPRARMIEVRRPPGFIDRFAHSPSSEVFAARIARCLYQPLFLLRLRAEPDERHEGESVHQQHGREAGIDGRYLLGDDLQIEIADASAAVFTRQETRRKAKFVGLEVSALHQHEGFLRVTLFVRFRDHRLENFHREFAGISLQLLLRGSQSEIDRHGRNSKFFRLPIGASRRHTFHRSIVRWICRPNRIISVRASTATAT